MKLEFNFNQSGVIPYRISNGHLEILLVTSLKKKKWIIPKGYVEFNLTPFESAKKEAYEEAGVLGANETTELGYFETKKSVGLWHVKVFSMEVTEILEDYPEKKIRTRKWFYSKDASEVISIPEVSGLIKKLEQSLK